MGITGAAGSLTLEGAAPQSTYKRTNPCCPWSSFPTGRRERCYIGCTADTTAECLGSQGKRNLISLLEPPVWSRRDPKRAGQLTVFLCPARWGPPPQRVDTWAEAWPLSQVPLAGGYGAKKGLLGRRKRPGQHRSHQTEQTRIWDWRPGRGQRTRTALSTDYGFILWGQGKPGTGQGLDLFQGPRGQLVGGYLRTTHMEQRLSPGRPCGEAA